MKRPSRIAVGPVADQHRDLAAESAFATASVSIAAFSLTLQVRHQSAVK
jgi:hypothetical protein